MNKIYEMLNELQPEHDFKDNNGAIDEETFDSFDLISLVTMIEEEFNILIDALDIIPENFSSVDTIVNMIRKNGGSI